MLKNYLTIAIRNMARNKLFAFINILGLSVGLACCIILFIYSKSELSFDRHHGKNIYRLISNIKTADGELFKAATSSVPIAPVIKEEIPEIIQAARATGSSLFGGKNVIRFEDNSWYIEDGLIADTSIFEILRFDIIQGNKSNPVYHSNALVLEKAWAKKIFGSNDPIGKIVKISTPFGESDFEITAIYDKSTYQSHLEPNFIVSMANSQWKNFFYNQATNWVGNNMVFTYLKLTPGANTEKVDQLIHEIFLKNGSEQMKAMGLDKEMDLQPVEAIHTDTSFMIDIPSNTNLTFIYVLSSIGILILILACVNYINLATAKAGRRALEVGIRKVMGVTPNGLIGQFLGESFLIVTISMFLGLILSKFAIPFFNQLITNPVQLTMVSLVELGPYLFGFLVFTGFVAGFYPAFFLASFKPHTILKGKGKDHGGNTLIRKSLVILQFVISISLISSILIISKQVDFIKNADLGFSADTKLIIPLSSQEASSNYQLLRDKFKTNSQVKNVSGSNSIPGTPIVNDLLVYRDGQSMEQAIHIYNNTIDLEYPQIMGLRLLSGTYFLDYEKDSTQDRILISKSGIDMLGIPADEAPGEIVHFDWEGRTYHYEIVGVVNDIHHSSLHKTIDPMMYTIGDGKRYEYMTVDADLSDFQSLVTSLSDQWKKIIKDSPFEYYGLHDHLLLQYVTDINTFNLIKYFALISIIISCLGLYAMSLFMAEKRFHEIGIRKTFGASIGSIFTMVSTELSKLILIAFILSIPFTWYGMKEWLESFAYRITPGLDTYLLAGIISILIGWLTIGYQSIKAARTNPVDVLREE